MNYRFGLLVGGLTLLASAAHAQLVFGDTYFSSGAPGLSGAFYLDVQSGNAQQLWTGANVAGSGNRRVDGLASDETNRVLYGNSAARLYKWDYATPGATPAFINGLYRLGSNGTTYATGVNGLAVANQKVYAYTNYNAGGSAAFVEDGIYEIDTSIVGTTPNMTLKWQHADLAYNLEGLDFNAANGLFYATNTSAANAQGIYTVDVFGTGTINKIADFDGFLPAPDGLAVGGGHVWLTGKASGGTELRIVGFNLTTGVYDEAFSLGGFPTTGYSTGAAWAPNALTPVPEPATLAALGLGAAALLRRRKRA